MSAPADCIADLKDERLHRLLAYWEGKRQGRRFPARGDIDPLDFPYAMGWASLIEIEHEPLRFRFRVHGSQVIARYEYDMTGRYLEDHPLPDFAAHCHQAWRDTLAQRRPTHGYYDHVIDGVERRFEVLRLPLATDGETIDMLLVCTVYSD